MKGWLYTLYTILHGGYKELSGGEVERGGEEMRDIIS